MATPFVLLASNNPTVTCFGSELMDRKLTTIAKTSWAPLDIHKSKVQVAVKHSTKANCTNSVEVVFTKEGRTFLVKTFLDEKLTFGHNWKANLWNQTDSKVLNGKKLLIMNNITSSKNLFCISWSFRKGCGEEKKPKNGAWGYLLPLSWRFTIRRWLRMRPKLLPKPLQQRGMVLFHMLYHGWYAIGLTICDGAFATPCAQGHNFGANCLSMANNASNDLALFPINLLIVVYLEERPNGWGPLVRLPPNKLLLHCFHQLHLVRKVVIAMKLKFQTKPLTSLLLLI